MIKAVIFDGGDTVIEDQPLIPGSMADWETIAETPGIRAILESLHSNVLILMASNAAISGEKQVRKALDRLRLNEYFDFIYTARELGTSKPDREFYMAILRFHDLQPEETLMVGDSLVNDAIGAVDAGMRSIWLNRDHSSINVPPSFDGEIIHFGQWETTYQRIQSGQIPSMKQVKNLFLAYPPSSGLYRHVQQVGLTAYFLGQMILLHGEDVSPILAHRAGLLHDIDKRVYKESGIPHGEYGARILESAGMTDIAGIVRRHQVFSVLNPATAPITWEQILVYLADKYIEKDRFVGLEERFSHFRKRYPDSPQLFEQSLPLATELENRILSILSMKRENLYVELARKIQRIPLME